MSEPTDTLQTLAGVTTLVCDPAGPPLTSEREATDLVGNAAWQGATWVLLPAARLGEDFFHLRTGLAGAITQKFVTYHLGLAVTGDISAHTTASDALGDFVRESNRGRHLWFLPDLDAFTARLTG
ncbi:DUF4180 domain-containing protein [Kineosporia sp. NBRC 101731]|uniref:DUF4180 domain-containing protein n=1 Tax=Kineosporia sp. NBRC 101731 TaxID=3032199 RepID=UPI00249FAA62|nr:DUF4180 domain-containing protein [Kineosporia sp. NBRC 101731]GLY29349.1 hypothetical protein Kisp02_27140 [Kineosporia sp. NBRC 101731]